MLAYLEVDMFCIRVDDWIALRGEGWAFPMIQLSFNRAYSESGGGWERWSDNYLTNIALEYDPSWLTDLPHLLFNLPYENSAPGYLAFLLQRMLLDGVTWPRMNQFSIIDKEAK